jgi:hypothetical protein
MKSEGSDKPWPQSSPPTPNLGAMPTRAANIAFVANTIIGPGGHAVSPSVP